MARRCGCLAAIGVLLAALAGDAWGSNYSPYSYGRWIPVGEGSGHNVQYLKVNPDDADVVICSSDAGGTYLTCDGGQSWSVVNHGLVSGMSVDGGVVFSNGRPNSAMEWDPVDSNYVFKVHRGHVIEGELTKGLPGRITWEPLGELSAEISSNVNDIAMDPDADPYDTGRAKIFYLVDRYGCIAFTNDGGSTVHDIPRIPFSDQADPNKLFSYAWGGPFAGSQNPLLTVILGNHSRRVIAVPCPTGTWYAWALHNQEDPCNNSNDPNKGVFWDWLDPNDSRGLPANVGANGFHAYWDGVSIRGILACDNSCYVQGGVYACSDLNEGGDWILRSRSSGGHFSDKADYTPSSLLVDPADPNKCYLVGPRGGEPTDPSFYRTKTLWSADPNDASVDPNTWAFDAPLDIFDPSVFTPGWATYARAMGGWAIDLPKCEPNTLYISMDVAVGVAKSTDGGSTWAALYTKPADPSESNAGLWSNVGIMNFHAKCTLFAPSDPNIYFSGQNDCHGSWKTEDRGKTFRQFFVLTWPNYVCRPTYLTYDAGGHTYAHQTYWFSTPVPSRADDPNDPNATASNFWVKGANADIKSGVVHPTDPNFAWFATFDRPEKYCSLVVKTTDGGESLTIVMPDDAWVPHDPWYLWDRDIEWDPANPNSAPVPPLLRHFIDMAANPNCTKLYLAAGNDGILMSSSADPSTLGDTWTVVLDPNDPNDMDPDDVDPNDPNGVVFVAVEVAAADPNIIYCASGSTKWPQLMCHGHVYKSTDAGQNWARVSPQLDTNYPSKIKELVICPEDANIVYVACYDWDACGTNARPGYFGIWKTANSGASWQQVFPDANDYSTAFCQDLAIDPKSPNDVYCTTRNKYVSNIPRPGIYIGRNNGTAWGTFRDWDCEDPNDPNYSLSHVISSFYSLDFHPMTGDLYVGTPGGAFWWPRDYALESNVIKCSGDPCDSNNYSYGRAYGTIYIDGEEWDPGNESQMWFPGGAEVTLDADPFDGPPPRYFVIWVGDLPNDVDPCDPQIVVTMDRDRQIAAVFVSSCGSGMGMPMIPSLPATMVGLLILGGVWRHRTRFRP